MKGILLLLFFLAFLSPFAAPKPMSSIRLVTYRAQPVEIVAMSVAGEKVVPGVKFATAGDWLKRLSVSVKNITDRRMNYVGVLVGAKRGGESTQAGVVIGVNNLAPGETAFLSLSEKDYTDMRTLMHGQSPSDVSIRLYDVDFGDDEAWHGGYQVRGSENGRWTTEEFQTGPITDGLLSPPDDPDIPLCTSKAKGNNTAQCAAKDELNNKCVWNDSQLSPTETPKDCVPEPFDKYCYGPLVGFPCLTTEEHTDLIPDSACTPPSSPIVFDLADNGFDLTDLNGGVRFDLNCNGVPERLSWTRTGTDDAWLALDRNGDGWIDSGAELFGNYTPQPESLNPNGFLALAEFDKAENGGNGDGRIDYRDAIFPSLRLWCDVNHNGISEPGELKPLTTAGVLSIALDHAWSRRVDRFGNIFRYKAGIETVKGATVAKQVWDVFLLAGA